ncbi:MAG: D-2-hydroxyacid dehydrogenase [Flavobacteriales bacterium]|nr:D-2-hydroxyacid dehydrogenase [Flavobacteriales bacterium]
MKVLANDGISAEGEVALKAAGFDIITENVPQDQLVDSINSNDYSALLVRSATTVRQDLIDACPGLKLIGRGGVGMDNIDVDYARGKGIEVINTPASSSQSVAELVFGHIFSLSRFLNDSNNKMPSVGDTEFKQLKKAYGKGVELRGRQIGIIGFGRIGQSVAKYALGCGMSVVAYDPFMTEASITVEIAGAADVTVNIKTTDFDTLISTSDVITFHVPMPEDGKPLINTAEMNKMKDGAILVNAARGGVINEADLIAALDSGKIGGAGLDVFENEPTPRMDLVSHSKVSATPHIGAATGEAQARIGTELAEKINAFFN